MEAVPCDSTVTATAAASPPTRKRGVNKAAFLANLVNRTTHNNPQYRLGRKLCPGKRAREWRVCDLARCGHAAILPIRLDKMKEKSGCGRIPQEECSSNDADWAAENGDLDVIRVLRVYDIHCTSEGADRAARGGHLEVIRGLREHGIHCTEFGAQWAALKGHLDIVQDLRAQGIHCTSHTANLAARGGHLHVIRDLRAHGIHCTTQGADMAAENGHLEVIRDLRAHGILCSPFGALQAAQFRHFHVVDDLKTDHIQTIHDGAHWNATHDRMHKIRYQQARTSCIVC